ncbi:MAG: peptidoglycan editing factor PgeF, partial [Oscillospiraceae bacterium]|nr:peptidoglycan editing factor PgeF [Oscillospiraceae bacterium]
NVLENYRRLGNALGFQPDNLVLSRQTHSDIVHVVTEQDRGAGLFTPHLDDCDGLITNVPGATLLVYTADCVPLFFLDPVQKAIGLVHSGRKGTLMKIGRVTVEAMAREYGSRPEDILCGIGPSICGDCYEIGDELLPEVEAAFGEAAREGILFRRGGKAHLNLWEANRRLLLEAGLKPEHIAVTNVCTKCNVHALYSYRGDGKIVNQIASLLTLRG